MLVYGAVVLSVVGLRATDDAATAYADTLPPVREVRMSLQVPAEDGGFEVVEITMFAIDDGSPGIEERIADGKAAMLARFPGAVELEAAEVAAQFKIFGIRWREPTASWFYNPAGATAAMQPDVAFGAVRDGAAGWTRAGGTPWGFTYSGETTTPSGCNGIPESIPRDGVNVVGWGAIAGGFLGYSCWWRSASLVEGTPYFEALEFDIVFEPIFPFTPQSLQALALHEFGHALGLDHTEPALCPGSAMCAGVNAMLFSEPQQDDLFGLIALYGLAPTPTPTIPALPKQATLPGVARD